MARGLESEVTIAATVADSWERCLQNTSAPSQTHRIGVAGKNAEESEDARLF